MLGETSDYAYNALNGYGDRSGLTTHYKQDGITFGMGSIALLDMLAEVASQTLQSDPSVKSTSDTVEKEFIHIPREFPKRVTGTKEIVISKSVKHNKKVKKPTNNHNVSTRKKKSAANGGKEYRATNKFSNLSANSLIKRFSEFDGNEMRRTFTFTCTFDLGHCQQRFSSFGSENKARLHMKDHLLQHIEARKLEVPSVLPISSNPGVGKQQFQEGKNKVSKKGRKPNNDKFSHSQVDPCERQLPNVENNNDLPKESQAGVDTQVVAYNVDVQETLWTTDLPTIASTNDAPRWSLDGTSDHHRKKEWTSGVGNITFSQHMQEDVNNAFVQEFSPELIVVQLEDEASVYSEHNYMRHNLTIDGNIENIPNICLRVVKEEPGIDQFHHRSRVNETKSNYDQIQETVNIKSMLNKRLICKNETINRLHDLDEALHKMDENEYFQSLPHIGQEVDISTSQLTVVSSALSSVPVGARISTLAVDLNLKQEGVYDNEVISSKFKKNKGNSKLLGQSEAEKNLAIRLIESIKYKGSHPDSLECNICSPTRFFTALTTLISHYRSHAGIKPYECRLCGHVFTRQHSLNYHLLIHGNVTRFECADCGRKFRHPSHFKEHRRRHTGEAPYECLDCPLRFKTRNTYKRHLKTRHGKVLTTSGGLISLSEEEFMEVGTVARSHSLPKKPAPRGHAKQDSVEATTFLHDSDECIEENSQNNHQIDLHNKLTGDHAESPSNDELDKENAMTKVKNKNNAIRNTCLLSANEAFHDIVEEAMRQSDVNEPSHGSATQIPKETCNSNDLDTAKDNNEMIQKNIAVNSLFIAKSAQKQTFNSSEDSFCTIKVEPLLQSKEDSKSENQPILPDSSIVFNTLLKQSVSVNVPLILAGNINTLNATYQRNILPKVKSTNIPTELRLICPNAPQTAIMLVTGHSTAKTNG